MNAGLDRGFLTTLVVLASVLALFLVFPLVALVERAFSSGNVLEQATSATARDALWLTAWTTALSTTLVVVLGTPLAYLVTHGRIRGSAVLDVVLDLPMVLPPAVAGVALLAAFGRRGLVGEPLESVTGLTIGFTSVAVVFAQVLVAGPFYVRAARAGFQRLDPQIEQVAYTLGASRARTFFRVIIPQARPALFGGVILCATRAMGELGATVIFAGNLRGETQTMPLAILQAFESSAGLDGAIALSMLLLALGVTLLVLFRFLTRKSIAWV